MLNETYCKPQNEAHKREEHSTPMASRSNVYMEARERANQSSLCHVNRVQLLMVKVEETLSCSLTSEQFPHNFILSEGYDLISGLGAALC